MTTAPVPAVKIEGVSKRYGRTLALDNVSFEVPPGELFALLGPNGAGKTTLLHILCTILRPDSGKALINGTDIIKNPVEGRRNLGIAALMSSRIRSKAAATSASCSRSRASTTVSPSTRT